MTPAAMPADSHSVRDTAFISDFMYNVPRRAFPPSATGSTPITKPRSKRYPSLAGAAGTESPGRSAGYRENTRPSLSYSAAATRWGSARRAERISLASAWLANASEAVLFAAMTRPSVDRFFSVICRNAATSYVTNAADVSSSTKLLISSRSAVSFFLIGQSRSDISRPRWIDDLGHPQELGADGQVCRLDHPEVDLEPDAVSIGDESDHASMLGESVGIAHREDRPALEIGEHAFRPVSLGPADEQDVADLDVFHSLVATHHEGPRSPTLPADRGIEHVAERIFAQHTNGQRRLGVRNGFRRPIDELGEIEQEHGLHLILRGPRRLRRQVGSRHERQRGPQDPRHPYPPHCERLARPRQPGAQKCHSSDP